MLLPCLLSAEPAALTLWVLTNIFGACKTVIKPTQQIIHRDCEL